MTESGFRIAILYDDWHANHDAAEEPAGDEPPPARRKKREKSDREEVFDALKKRGHEPRYICLDGRARSLKSLASVDADLVFNLTESYAGDDTKDINIAAYLDLVGVPYTGSGPAGLHLAQDKTIAKRLFSCIHSAVGECFDLFAGQLVFATVGHRADELLEHLIDQSLQVRALLGRNPARYSASVNSASLGSRRRKIVFFPSVR